MRNQKTRNRHQPVPHMVRMAEQALRMEGTPIRPDRRTALVLAYMDEFGVCEETARRMIRNDPRRSG